MADARLAAALDASLTGIDLLRPLSAPDGTLADFAIEYLSPESQRMLGLPEHPNGTLLTQYPQTEAEGMLAFYRRVFETGEAGRYDLNYQPDGLDNCYQVVARRCGALLLVRFTDPADQSRSAAELALRDSQVREQAAQTKIAAEWSELQGVFEQASVGFAVFRGPRYVIELANAAVCAMWGRTPAQALNTPLFELLPEAAGQGFEELLDGVLATGIPYVAHELPSFIDRGGRRATVYWDFVYNPLRTADGTITGITVVATDVSEQVAARQQMQRLNEELEVRVAARTRQLRMITDAVPVLIGYLDHEQRYQFTNHAYEAWFGQKPEALLGRFVREVVGEAAYAGVRGYIERALAGEQLDFEAKMPYRPDFVKHIRTSFVPDVQDGVVVGMYSLVVDITEQVEARLEVDRQRQVLYGVFMEAPVPIVILDGPALVYQLVNPAYQRMLPGRTLLGRPILLALPELVGTPVPAMLRQAYETGHTFEAREMPLRLARHAGGLLEEMYFTFTYQGRRNAHGTVDGVLVFAHDVTAQVMARRAVEVSGQLARNAAAELSIANKELAFQNGEKENRADELVIANTELAFQNDEKEKLATELIIANQELGTANQLLTRTNVDLDSFIYTASHDLRAPITNIEGLITALQSEWPATSAPSAVPAMLSMMHGAVARFKTTLDHLSNVVKLQKEHDEALTELPLANVVEDVRLDLLPLLTQTGATLEVAIDCESRVAFSAKNLRSVVYNLLSNAVKYHQPDRPPHVRISCRQEDAYTVLTVQDNGLGLTPAQQAQLFVMFRRLHSHVEGSGVGLYMLKRSVENAGGRVEVTSEAGVGSTFSVYFRR